MRVTPTLRTRHPPSSWAIVTPEVTQPNAWMRGSIDQSKLRRLECSSCGIPNAGSTAVRLTIKDLSRIVAESAVSIREVESLVGPWGSCSPGGKATRQALMRQSTCQIHHAGGLALLGTPTSMFSQANNPWLVGARRKILVEQRFALWSQGPDNGCPYQAWTDCTGLFF